MLSEFDCPKCKRVVTSERETDDRQGVHFSCVCGHEFLVNNEAIVERLTKLAEAAAETKASEAPHEGEKVNG